MNNSKIVFLIMLFTASAVFASESQSLDKNSYAGCTAGKETLVSCKGDSLIRRNSEEQWDFSYTVKICEDSQKNLTMEVWPLMAFSDHAKDDFRTIKKPVKIFDVGNRLDYVAKNDLFTLSVTLDNDSYNRYYTFYDHGSRFGEYYRSGNLDCWIKE